MRNRDKRNNRGSLIRFKQLLNSSDNSTEQAIDEKIDYRYSIITVLVVSTLVYLLKTLAGMEKQLFLDSQYEFFSVWNAILQIGEAIFLSAFFPVGLFVLKFIFYFVPNSNVTTKSIEVSYSRAIIYLIFCIIFFILLAPVQLLFYYGHNNLSIIGLLVLVAIVYFIVPLFINKFVTKEPVLRKGYLYYLVIGVAILVLKSSLSLYEDSFPSISMEKDIYYSSEDKIAIVTFEGKAVAGYLCNYNECLKSPNEGILLERYYDTSTSKTKFIVDLTDPKITMGTYDVKVYYQSGISFINNEGVETGSGQADDDWYRYYLTRSFQYVFDGDTSEQREQYYSKYMTRINLSLNSSTPKLSEIKAEMKKFTNTIKENNYYIGDETIKKETRKLRELLADDPKNIFDEMLRDLVFYSGA